MASDGKLDVHGWVEAPSVPVVREGPWGDGGYKWVLEECIWNGHTDYSAYIVQGKEGWIYAGRQHDSCKTWDNRWREVREHYEPGCYDRGEYGENAEYDEKKAAFSERGRQFGLKTRNGRSEHAEYAECADFIELPSAEEFPVNVLPEPLRTFVKEASNAVGCPPDFVGVSALTVMNAAVGNSRRAYVKRGWYESPTLYAAIIAESGSKKTPADKATHRPVERLEQELKEVYDSKVEAWGQEESTDKKPKLEQVVMSDTIVEALFSVLLENYRGVLISRDELSGWARALDQYKGGKGSDRQHWLSLWSNSPIRLNRKSDPEPTLVPHPFVTLYGGIQPTVLPELIDDREDGLLDRFLLSSPDISIAPRWSDYEISESAERDYDKLYRKLRALEPARDNADNPFPSNVTFDGEAKAYLIRAINRLGEQTTIPGFPYRLRSMWSKLEDYLCRLSLLICLMRTAWTGEREVITREDVAAASRLIRYFQVHVRRVVVGVYGESPADTLSRDVAEFLTQNGGYFRGTPTELDNALQSESKPGGVHNLTRTLAAIASRSPRISFNNSEENYYKPDGKRSKRRIVTLSLETAYSAYSPPQSGGFKPNEVSTPENVEKASPYSAYSGESDSDGFVTVSSEEDEGETL